MLEQNKVYEKIGKKLIAKLPEFDDIKNSAVKIAYLSSDQEKKTNHKIIYADCTKIPAKYRWCCDYDFMITVYEPNILSFNDKQIEILIRHELHHVGIYTDTAEPTFYIVPHDIEEFWEIIDNEGLRWDS